MRELLFATAAMMPQTSWTLPPPRLDPDTTVTYSQQREDRRPRADRVWAPRRYRPAATRPYPAAAARAPVPSALSLRQGEILIETARHRLSFAVSPGRVETFPVAVGKWGAAWKGTAVVGRKVVFPTWRPTAHMRRQDHRLPDAVAPGRHNPLGTRAIYLYRDGRDTLFRIHGTNAPWSIGKSVSHGCIRMFNRDVEHLFGEVRLGARVTVR